MYFNFQLRALRDLRVKIWPVICVLALSFLASGCASPSAWPQPQITYTHAATHSQASAHIQAWRAAKPGNYDSHAALTGSMRPHIHGGPREFLLLEPAGLDTPLQPGVVVGFFRDADTPRCLHMIAALRGDHVYLSGTNNRYSDGWYHRSTIHSILRGIVTLPVLSVQR